MNITLVNPALTVVQNPQFFMSILYLATALDREGHKVNIIDSQIEDSFHSLERVINKTDCIGFSVTTIQVKNAIELSDYAKKIDPKIPIIWGGCHPTMFPEQTISDKSVDYVIRGEGELAFLEFIEFLQGNRKPEDVAGLVYEKNGKIHQNPEKPFLDLNTLSPPNWNMFKMEKYIDDFILSGENFGSYLPLHSGRGCPYRCSFCINTILKTRKWRPLTAENIINEIKILKERYKIKFIRFVDDNLFLDKSRVKEFCNGMIQEKIDIKWHASCRADYFNHNHLNEELLSLVKKAGCTNIAMGIESGSQKILDLLKKDAKVEDAIRAVEACKKFDIIPACSFMIGLPEETKKDMLKTLQFISKLKSINKKTVILGPQTFRPYPGCELYNKIKHLLNEPKILRDWMKTEILFGFYTPKYLPWVKEPNYLTNLCFYMRLAESYSNFFAELAKLPFKKIANFRIKHRIFGFPIDKTIYSTAKRYYFNFKKILS